MTQKRSVYKNSVQKNSARKNAPPNWDLSFLYKSLNSPRLKRDLKQAEVSAVKFRRKYSGKIAKIARSQEKFAKMMQDSEKLKNALVKPVIFAHLYYSECATDQKRSVFVRKMDAEYTRLSSDGDIF